MKRPAHRPKRSYPEAPIHRSRVSLETCPFCGSRLISTGSREVDKYVQTLSNPVHVIGYSRKCSNPDCPQPRARYHAPQADKLSLPHVTYGLDVMAYIAHQRNGEQKQFKEIRDELRTEFGIEISEREVGRLYRKIQALLLGNQAAIHQKLTAAVEEYGRLIMEVDGLEPDGGGPKLYVLHELLSSTVISVAMVEQANAVNLIEWLKPYREWRGVVKATLSDNEKALVAALKATWPEAAQQLCQLHFVKNLSEPVHEADRDLQKALRDAMGQVPSVPALSQEPADDVAPEAAETPADEEQASTPEAGDSRADGEDEPPTPRPSPALMQALDVVSGVELEALDAVSPTEWESLLSGGTQETRSRSDAGPTSGATSEQVLSTSSVPTQQNGIEAAPDYLSASETVEWVTQTMLAQVPASARPLVEETPSEEAVTYWEHTWYRRAIQDTRHLGSRKPFVCGGLRGYEQLRAIADHLAVREEQEGLDAYLSQLQVCAQRAVEQARPLADEVRQAKQWIIRVEKLLADEPVCAGLQPPSAVQRQRMRALLAECEGQEEASATVRALQHTWRRMLDTWEADLYHCYDIAGLPRSNLGIEALFGQARRQQRRLRGQSDTSPLAVTGQGYLRADADGQVALLQMFQQVPAWVYRLASRCVEAIEAGIRWPKQLHRDTSKALHQFQAQAEELRQHLAPPNALS